MRSLADMLGGQRGESSVPQRRRSARASANDQRLRQALLELVNERGWHAVTMAGLASHAGFSPTVVRSRAQSVAELGIDLWRHVVGEVFHGTLTSTLEALHSGDGATMLPAFHAWSRPEPALKGAIELMVAGLFDHQLAAVVTTDAQRMLNDALDWTQPVRTAADATMLGIVMAFALGYSELLRDVAAIHVPFAQGLYTADDASQESLPPVPSTAWTRIPNTDDPYEAAIVTATVEVLATHGYRHATMARISQRAGVSAGAITSRFPDKAHLMAHAARVVLMTPAEMDAEFEQRRAAHGDAVAQTMWVRDLMSAQHRAAWALRLDLALMARHEPALAEFTAHTVTGPYFGYMLLACLLDGLDDLPLLGPITAGLANYHHHMT